MDSKKKSIGIAVTEGTAQGVLRRGAARELISLAPDEEKVMRMRLGASAKRTDKLQRVAVTDTDADIELLSFEIEAYLRIKEMRQSAGAEMRIGQAMPSRAKEKIIRALRKKK